MYKLMLPAAEAGYTAQPGETVKRVQLAGGKGRYRKDVDGATSAVNVTWVCPDELSFAYLGAFYRKRAAEGAVSVLIDLNLGGLIQEHVCNFLPGTYGLREKNGDVYTVTAQLEVVQLIDDDNDYEILDLFENP